MYAQKGRWPFRVGRRWRSCTKRDENECLPYRWANLRRRPFDGPNAPCRLRFFFGSRAWKGKNALTSSLVCPSLEMQSYYTWLSLNRRNQLFLPLLWAYIGLSMFHAENWMERTPYILLPKFICNLLLFQNAHHRCSFVITLLFRWCRQSFLCRHSCYSLSFQSSF